MSTSLLCLQELGGGGAIMQHALPWALAQTYVDVVTNFSPGPGHSFNYDVYLVFSCHGLDQSSSVNENSLSLSLYNPLISDHLV